MVTQQELKRQLFYDEKTGNFTRRVVSSNRTKLGQVAGGMSSDGYWSICVCNERHRAHRLAWLYVYGEFPKTDLDHVNRVKTDNRIKNLRESTKKINAINTNLAENNKSSVKGIHFSKMHKKWNAQIKTNGKSRSLGFFNDFLEAVFHRFAAEQCLGFDRFNKNSSSAEYIKNVAVQ